MNRISYDADFYGWANEQAALLREGRLAEADIANIAEEIESMGRSEKRELTSRLAVLLTHCSNGAISRGRRSASWSREHQSAAARADPSPCRQSRV